MYDNPHEVASEAIEKNASEARTRAIALEMYADKTYTEENKGMKNGATALMLFCNSYSIGTVCAFLGLSTLPAIAEHSGKIIAYGAGGVLVLGMAATLEYVKVQSAKNFTKARLRYKKFAKVAFAGWVLTFGGSAAASFYGAQMLPSQVVAQPVWSAAAFDAKETTLQAEIEAIRKSAQWQGITTKAGLKQIEAVRQQQAALAEEKAAAKREHDASLAAHGEKVAGYEWVALWVAIACELIILACSSFIAYYYYRGYLSAKAEKPAPQDDTADDDDDDWVVVRKNPINVPKTAIGIQTAAPNTGQAPPPDSQQRPRIGFEYGKQAAEQPSPTPATEDEKQPQTDGSQCEQHGSECEQPATPPNFKNPYLRECKNCTNTFQYKSTNKLHCSEECRLDYRNKLRKKEVTDLENKKEGAV